MANTILAVGSAWAVLGGSTHSARLARSLIAGATVIFTASDRVTVNIADAVSEVGRVNAGIVGVTNPIARTLLNEIAGGGWRIARI